MTTCDENIKTTTNLKNLKSKNQKIKNQKNSKNKNKKTFCKIDKNYST